MKYILLVFVALAMGFTTSCAATSVRHGYWFAFGVHIAFDIWWVLQIIDLAFNW